MNTSYSQLIAIMLVYNLEEAVHSFYCSLCGIVT